MANAACYLRSSKDRNDVSLQTAAQESRFRVALSELLCELPDPSPFSIGAKARDDEAHGIVVDHTETSGHLRVIKGFSEILDLLQF